MVVAVLHKKWEGDDFSLRSSAYLCDLCAEIAFLNAEDRREKSSPSHILCKASRNHFVSLNDRLGTVNVTTRDDNMLTYR